jgi:hypothetical protein
MPDIRKHRGSHPEDRKLFAGDQLMALCTATTELSWLLTRAYSIKGALKLVGDRHSLTERQRVAIARAACSDQSRQHRADIAVEAQQIRGHDLVIDGFNLLITIEAALSGGVLMLCRDGCIRDLSSIHGSYRSVQETEAAILLIGDTLAAIGAASVLWILDKPISNSGRLAQTIRRLASQRGWDWSVELAFNPDGEIAASDRIVVSSDGPLLDQITRSLNLSRHIIEKNLADAWLINLS